VLTDKDLLVKRNPASWLILASLVAYGVSFLLPAYGHPNNKFLFGAHAFVISIFALEDGTPFWLANPSYWIAIVLLFRGTTNMRPLAFSVIAILLASSAVCVFDVRPGIGGDVLLYGYYTWLISFGFATAASAIELRRFQTSKHTALECQRYGNAERQTNL
jgi:hypothetical protein